MHNAHIDYTIINFSKLSKIDTDNCGSSVVFSFKNKHHRISMVHLPIISKACVEGRELFGERFFLKRKKLPS